MASMVRKREGYFLDHHKLSIALVVAKKNQRQLADYLGYHNTWVSQVARGVFKASVADVNRIAGYLDCKVGDIVAGKQVRG